MAAREPSAERPATATAIRGVRPLSPALVCLVAAVVAVAWLGAAFANVAPLAMLPAWLRGVARTPLVLAVPALVIPAFFVLLAWPRRVRPAQHARSLYAAQALALVVVALPALLPFSPALITQSLGLPLAGMILFITMALRAPGLSLGVALAMADPLVIQRARSAGPPRSLAPRAGRHRLRRDRARRRHPGDGARPVALHAERRSGACLRAHRHRAPGELPIRDRHLRGGRGTRRGLAGLRARCGARRSRSLDVSHAIPLSHGRFP